MRRALREVRGLYWDSGLADDVPALAWYLVASLAPLALGLTALLGDSKEAQQLAARAASVLPKDVHDQIVQLVLRTKQWRAWCGRARARSAWSNAACFACSAPSVAAR